VSQPGKKPTRTVFLVAHLLNGTKLSNGTTLKAGGPLQGSPSPLFDALAVILSR
jgi:hypothetical protein